METMWLMSAGGDYTEMGLAATTVASSFGKVVFVSSELGDRQIKGKGGLMMRGGSG